MASAFGHAVAAVAIGKTFPLGKYGWKFWLLAMGCAVLPDADVIAFQFGIPYEHVLGHRGITHSFFFAALLALFVVKVFFPAVQLRSREGVLLLICFFLCTASHTILDAMTTGGRGVAFFAPFDNERYWLPWRVIKVSPLSMGAFFSEWGWRVIKSELVWIGVPSVVVIVVAEVVRRIR